MRNAKTGGTNNFPQPEKYVQKLPTGAWDKFADKKGLDPMVYDSAAHGLLSPSRGTLTNVWAARS